MLKKMCKGVCFFLFVLFMAGSFCFIPNLKVGSSEAVVIDEEFFQNHTHGDFMNMAIDEMYQQNYDDLTFVTDNGQTFIERFPQYEGINAENNGVLFGSEYFTAERYGHKNVMVIKSTNEKSAAQKLAEIASWVNLGDNVVNALKPIEKTEQMSDEEYNDRIEEQKLLQRVFGLEGKLCPVVVMEEEGNFGYEFLNPFTYGVYSLEEDVDLQGSLWTPIGGGGINGNIDFPFSGVFYGNGHTISNFVISNITASQAGLYGLFGYTQAATICDLMIDGSNKILTSYTDNAGSLVGVNSGSYIINCFDKGNSIDQNGDRLYIIGYHEGNPEECFYFIGNTFDGVTPICKNYFDFINYTVTLRIGNLRWDNPIKKQYMTTFSAGEGEFKIGNEKWYDRDYSDPESKSKVLKVLYDEEILYQDVYPYQSENHFKPLGTRPDGLRAKTIVATPPKLRVDTENENEVYIINPGFKASFESEITYNTREGILPYLMILKEGADLNNLKTTDCILDTDYIGENAEIAFLLSPISFDIKFSDEKFVANFNYGYGEYNSANKQRSGNIELPYDTPFCEIFERYPGLKERAGYNFSRLYYSVNGENGQEEIDVDIETANDFKNSYPNRDTYNFEWIYNGDVQRNFGVTFAYSLDEGGKIVDKFASVDQMKTLVANQNGVALIEGIKEASAGMLDKGIIYENSNPFDEGSDSYTFKITLARGYRLVRIGNEHDLIRSSNNEGLKNSDTVEVENHKANFFSGAYPNFTAATGLGFDYNGNDTRNYDNYNVVYTSLKWLNAGESFNASSNTSYFRYNEQENFYREKEYEITVENVVGPGGHVVLVIERDWTYIDVTPHLVETPTSFYFNIDIGWQLKELEMDIGNGELQKVMCPVDKDGNMMITEDGRYEITPLALIKYGKGIPCPQAMEWWRDEEGNDVRFEGDWGPYYFNDQVVASNGEYSFYLQVRKNEDFTLKISSETIGRYILNIENDNFVLENGGADESVFSTYKNIPSEDAKGVFEGAEQENNFYDKWDVSFKNPMEYLNTFRPYIGTVKTKLAVSLFKGDETDRQPLDDMTGIGVSINNSSYFQNVTGELFGMSSTGVVASKKSGKYQAYKVVISELLEGTKEYGNPVSYIMSDSGEKYTDAYYETSYLSPSGNMLFKKAFTHGEEALYQVDVYYKERNYEIKVEYYAGSKLVPIAPSQGESAVIAEESVDQIKSEFADRYFQHASFGLEGAQLPSILNGDGKYSFSFLLNKTGKGALSYAGYELYQDGKLKVGFGNSSNPEAWEKEGYTNSSLVEPTDPGLQEGDFKLTLGGYDTTIKIFFEYRTVSLLIDSVHVLDEEGYLTVADKALLAYTVENLTYKIGADGGLTLSNGSNELSSISIHSQFYLLGWYLKGGKAVVNVDSQGNFNGLLTNADFVASIAELGSDSEGNYINNDISALVGRRTVSVSYNAGAAEYGRLYANDDERLDEENRNLKQVEDNAINRTKAAVGISYSQLVNLSRFAFYNLGYSFKSYIPNGVTVNGTFVAFGHVDNDNMTYSISAQGWDELFRQPKGGDGSLINNIGGDSFQTWNGLAESQLQRRAEVELIAQWQKIAYSAIIDESTIISNASSGKTGLSIGDTIYYTTSTAPNNKDGLAVYIISGDTFTGQTIHGYYAKGFSISQDSDKEGFESFDSGEVNKITITPDIFLQFIKDEYRFAVNSGDDNIYINTIREEADYLIYLENSVENYYRYDWNENLDVNDYGLIENGRIALRVKFNNPATSILKAIEDGVLVISRNGYTADKNLWSIAGNGGQSVIMFKPSDKYMTTGDVTIVPTWIKDDNGATKSEIYFNDDVGEIRNFYLLQYHAIISATAGGNHVGENVDILRKPILNNGEQVVGMRFIVVLNNKDEFIFENIKSFNIDKLNLAGAYTIKFEIDVKDTLTKYNESGAYSIEYAATSKILSFNMVRNELFIFDHNFSSIYNGSNEFTPSIDNDFGKFIIRYDWNGEDLSKGEVNNYYPSNIQDYFINYSISGDYNASRNANDKKDLKLMFDPEKDVTDGEPYNFANLLTNVFKEEEGYFITFENVLYIEKAKVTVHFPNGSAYRFDGANAVVYENSEKLDFTGDFANGKTFNYTFDRIMLLVNEAAVYTGNEDFNLDREIFTIYGLKFDGDYESNFEWNIANFENHGDSRFILKEVGDAKGYTFNLAYLLSTSGKLNNLLTKDYLGQSDKIYLSDIMIDGKAYPLGDIRQGSIEIGNDIVFSFAGNGTDELKLFVNDEVMAIYPFTARVNISLSEERMNALKVLTFTNNLDISTLEGMFDTWRDSGYSTTISPSITDEKDNTLTAVLTDVVKVYIDYNTGRNFDGDESEIIYVSVANNGLEMANPFSNEGSFLAFNGFQTPANSRLKIEFDDQLTTFTVINSGSVESITAKWNFTDFTFNVHKDVSIKASENEIAQLISSLALIETPNGSSLNASMRRDDDKYRFAFNASSGAIIIKDSQNMAGADLSGNYKLIVSVTYNDGFGDQTLTKEGLISFEIEKNTVFLTFVNQDLTYNNKVQNVEVITYTEDNDGMQVNLQNLPKIDNSVDNRYHFHIDILDALGDPAQLKNAGKYTVKATIDSKLQQIYEFNDAAQTVDLPLVIKKYTIALKDYASEIGFVKYVGTNDPSLRHNIEIEHDGASESVEVLFERETGGAVGEYLLINPVIVDDDNKVNYTLDKNDFEAYLVIQTPNANLQVELKEKPNYIYNSLVVNKIEVTVENNQFVLSLYNDETLLEQVEFDLYYLSVNGEEVEKIYISNDAKEDHLKLLNFSFANISSNAGEYPLSVELNEVEGFDYSGIEFVDLSIAKLKIEKKGIDVLSISKKFNRNSTIGRGDAKLDGVVTGDEVYITGSYPQIVVGQALKLNNVALAGADAVNYRLKETNFYGDIIAVDGGSVLFDANVKEFAYGNFRNGISVNDALSLIKGYSFSIGGILDDIKNGYVQISAVVMNEIDLSTGGFLKAGRRSVKFVFTSENFTNLQKEGYEVIFEIKALEIDLSSLEISKKYDETSFLPEGLDENIDQFILEGDVVSIDRTKGGYQTADIGNNKKVTLMLKGVDKENYKVRDNVTGSITAFTIIVTVNASTEHVDLVSGGRFVADNIVPIGDNATFNVGYPYVESNEDILAIFKAPSRKGYTFIGWKVKQGEDYITLDESNIENVLKQLTIDSNDDNLSLTIYAVWEIEKYEINISGSQIDETKTKFKAVPENALNEIEGKLYIDYFSDLQVEIVGKRGYKIRSYNLAIGQAENKNLTDTGKNKGIITFEKLTSRIELIVTFEEILITFNIDFNMPEFTNRVDNNSLKQTFAYFALENITRENLPLLAVTEGTYIFRGYSFNDVELDENPLKDLVDQIYTELNGDQIIDIKALWQGVEYIITFDPTQGVIADMATAIIEAVYGQAISPFPQAILEGREAIWQANDGKVYAEGDKLASIGEKNEDETYAITLTAQWVSQSFDLNITYDEGLNLKINGQEVSNGSIFSLVYGQDSLSLEITAKKGYGFRYDSNSIKAIVEEINGRVVIRNLFEDGTLHFVLEPNVNTLTLFNSNIESFKVYINNNEVNASSEIQARTGQSVQIVFKAKKGYSFDATSCNFRGEGSFTTNISEDGKTLTIKWDDFTGNAVATIDGVPSINNVTIGDVRDIFMRLTFGTTNINLSGDNFLIKTGERFVIYGVMAYGYTAGMPNTGATDYVEEGSVQNYYSEDDKYYHFTAVISGFDEDFEITFIAQARSFNFNISVMQGMEEYGEITCPSQQKVDFGKEIILSQRELISNFEFTGWMIEDQIISTEGNINYIVSSAIKDALERAGEDGIIQIYACYARKARDISLTARTSNNSQTNKNGFIASQIDENISIEVNGTTTGRFYLGLNLDITLNMAGGYELDYVLVDGNRINLNDDIYHFDGNKFAIALELDSTISSLEVVFKAGEIDVIVQAGTIVNYVDSLGTDVGGTIWAVDQNGDRLSTDVYKEYQGKLLLGANYKLLSHTDEVLYFEVEAKNGFTASISTSVGLLINELNINGKKIYAVTGASNNSTITVLFTARENKLNIIFSNEGEEIKPVHGGVFVVDTKSALVSSNPSRGDNLQVSIVTGGTLNFTASSMISYSLVADENGKVKYDLIGGELNENIIAGVVENQDPVKTGTGFTASANLSIGNIISDGTIVIYVKPKEYTVKFVLDVEKDISVTMTEKVRYGEAWSLDSLSDSEKGKIFASKKDYTFTGYFTAENSYGTQYIDRNGQVVINWQHSGFTYDGTKYQVDGNFDPLTDTFTLFAGWIYNRATVRVEVVPVAITANKDLNIRSFATNINNFNPWISQEDLWYAEIGVDSTLKFTAPKIEGYVFVGFSLIYNNGEEIAQGESFSLTLEMANYIVRAKYNPTISFRIKNENNDLANGGNSFARQDGGIIGDNYDINKILTLVATPNAGYNFLYWIDNDTEEIYYGQTNTKGEFIYNFEGLVDRPLSFTAVFEGKTIDVTFDCAVLGSTHRVLDVKVNGNIVDYNYPFRALVGDTIVVRIKKTNGYGFDNSLFDYTYDEKNDCYVFTYTIKESDLTVIDSTKYSLYMTIPITKEDISIAFFTSINDAIDNSEYSRVGYLEYFQDSNAANKIENGKPIIFKFGDTYNIRIVSNENYGYLKTFIILDDVVYDISSFVSNGILQINQELMERYFNYNLQIQVVFKRLLWTDEDSRASNFIGQGTAKEPYLISSAKEFALMSYLVNNRIENDKGVKYSNCYYKITKDIDFYGRFWEPVGTNENPFAGTIDFGKHVVKNVSHYKTYSSPSLSHSGLFWHVSKDAKFKVDKQAFNTIIIVICVLIFVIILIILLIILLTIRRKKKLEKLANQ